MPKYKDVDLDEFKKKLMKKSYPIRMGWDSENRYEVCPHCGRKLTDYQGLKECYCKFCGGAIWR